MTTYHQRMVWHRWNRPQTLCPVSPHQTPSPASWCLWWKLENRAGKFHKSDPVFAPGWSGHCKRPDNRICTVSQPQGQKCGRRAWPRFPQGSVRERDYEWVKHETLGKEGLTIHSWCRLVTHRDPPGTFAVRFVEAREALTANKAWVSHQVSSTVEHRPEESTSVRSLLRLSLNNTNSNRALWCNQVHWGSFFLSVAWL